jgi:predicted nucleic acid-binding protein
VNVVVDASVAIKWVVKEELTGAALGLFDRGYRMTAPDFLLIEGANVLWKKVRRGELSQPYADRALALLRSFALDLVSTVTLLDDAFALAHEIEHPVYDCLYLAVAQGARGVVVTDTFGERVDIPASAQPADPASSWGLYYLAEMERPLTHQIDPAEQVFFLPTTLATSLESPPVEEVLLIRDIAGKFSGTKTFIENLEAAVPYFYSQVGEHMRAYVPPPPRLLGQRHAKADDADEIVEDCGLPIAAQREPAGS